MLLIVVWAGGLLPANAQAQERAWVSVETNWSDAVVYADSLLLGPVRRAPFAVPAGTRQLRLEPPENATWSIRPVSTTFRAAPGDTVSVQLSFPYHYRIASVPYGVSVYRDRSEGRERLGQTPLLYRSDQPLRDPLLLDKPGYATRRITPDSSIWNNYQVTLDPAPSAKQSTAEVAWDPPARHRAWIDYAAAGVTLAAAAFSIHSKFKADRLYDEYQESEDPSLRSRVRAYDTRAAIGLGVAQVGIGVFAIRLVLR